MAKLWEDLSKGLADAVKDIREKVVEEPLWGRAVTERDAAPQGQEASEQPGFGSQTSHYEKGERWPEAQQPQSGIGSHTQRLERDTDQDIER